MAHGIQIAATRLLVLMLALAIQVYIFMHIRRAVRSLPISSLFKSAVLVMVGLAIIVLCSANRYFILSPVIWVEPLGKAQSILVYASAVWTFGSILSAIVLLAVSLAKRLGRMAAGIFRSDDSIETSPPDPGRRLFLKAGVCGMAATPFAFSGYNAVFTSKAFEVRELALPFAIPMRVLQLTDIHSGVFMTREEIRRLADKASALEPDLFVLTGDYITSSMKFLPDCLEEMSRVRARFGTFASLGNHEHWYGSINDIRNAFSQYDIPLLINAHEVIHSDRGDFAVAGIDDLRAGAPDLKAALRGLDPGLPTILLSHRPEIFPEAASHGISLTLAGHYHGGQIKLSLPTGDLSVANLLTPYPEGHFHLNDSNLYVSRGIGTTFTPVRNVPPEITLLKLG
jgi:hypothetical protein